MANDCDCKVRITGEAEDLQRLFNKLQIDEVQKNGSLNSTNYELLFESIDDVEDWGSKWQVFSNIDYSEGDTMMFIDGYSAWGPADGLWKKISSEFNTHIVLDYSEPGMDFAGVTEFNDGVETMREEMTYWNYLYTRDYDYFWEEISYRSECYTLDELKEALGDFYNQLSQEESLRLEEVHKENFSE